MNQINLWRVNLKPVGISEAADYCIKYGIVGIGWGVNPTPARKDDYLKYGRKEYEKDGPNRGWRKATNAFLFEMSRNHLVWTRTVDGKYYLGRIKGRWKYYSDKEHADLHMVNTRTVDWQEVGEVSLVPGKIFNSFSRGGTVRHIDDETVLQYSMHLYNKLVGKKYYNVERVKIDNIFSMLHPEDLEDVVGLYLQITHDYVLQPSTCKKDTQLYEAKLVSKDGRRVGYFQVKSGSEDIDCAAFTHLRGTVYLFTAMGNYLNQEGNRNIVIIDKGDLQEFIIENMKIMTERLRFWMESVYRV